MRALLFINNFIYCILIIFFVIIMSLKIKSGINMSCISDRLGVSLENFWPFWRWNPVEEGPKWKDFDYHSNGGEVH